MCRYCLVISLFFHALCAVENSSAAEHNIEKIEQNKHNLLNVLKQEQQSAKSDRNISTTEKTAETNRAIDSNISISEINDTNLTERRGASRYSPKDSTTASPDHLTEKPESHCDNTGKIENNSTKIPAVTAAEKNMVSKPETIDADRTKAKLLEAQLLAAIKKVGPIDKEIEAIDRKIEKLQKKLKAMEAKMQ